MSFNDDYLKLRKKRLEEQQKQQKNAPFVFESGPYQNATLTADDIAPVKNQNTVVIDDARDIGKKNTGSGLFKAGTFADGYQFGDRTKAKLGTVADVVLGIVQGVAGIGEGLGDLAMYGVAGVQDLVGNDDDAERLRKATQEDIIAPLFDSLRKKTNIDDTSLLGDFGYGIAQGVGQVGAVIATGGAGSAAGLGTVGTSALTTGMIGASSMGSGMSEAYQGGATDEEALTYGVSKGVIDAGTEMIFGGLGKAVKAIGVSKGISSLDDWFAKKLSSKMSNQFFKNATQYGVKATAEGLEEVAAGYLSAVTKKLTYMSEEDFQKIKEDENLLEQFVAGALVSGIAQSGDLVKSTKQGRDFITNFSGNEETVIEKVYNDRVAEAEQDGTKLTNKEKNKLYEQVQEDMRKGYISTDTIESVLGGETYKSYKDTVDSEDAILKEFDELGKKQNATLAEQARYAELQAQVKEIKSNSNRNNLKSQLSEEVYNSVKEKDFYLAESYNERARRGTAFEADLSQYDDKTAETVKRAIDSGILNNTRRTHEFVDMVAKISADKGVLFDFTNNQKLKESGFAVGGASINGYVTKDGITVNISSSKATNSIVGHEITHVLEGTELYAEMQTAIFEYAKSKKDYEGRRKSLEELYKNVEDADIDAELTADLVGDYLFTDADFINNLSTKHRNVFQKIYDEIKYLLKIATKGSKEARELEKVKRAFEKAYRANGNTNEGTKYSLSDSDGKKLTKEQSEYFKDSKMRDENGNLKVMYHGSQDAGFHVFDANMSDDDTSLFFVDRNDVAASYSGTSETYEAQTIRTAEDMNNFIESIGVEGYEVVEKDGKFTLLYEGDRIADSNTAKGIYEEFCWYEGVGEGDANYKVYLNLTNPLEVDAEGRSWNEVSTDFSQELYDEYSTMTEAQKSALTQAARTGTGNARSFYNELGDAYSRVKYQGATDEYSRILNHFFNNGLTDTERLFAIVTDNFSDESIKQNSVKKMNTRDYAKKAKAEGYDGVIFKNIVDNGPYGGGGASTVAIAFESNQIKSVANEKPTSNPDIRYSLSEYTEEEKKAHNKAVLEHFGKTYSWAETGYLLLDGTRLDLSGKHDEAPGGYRTVDHRDITEALGYDYGGGDYSGSLVQFMSEGNIRIIPECNGINLSVKPTKAQEQALSNYISRYRGEVLLDIDDLNGNTVVSVEYPYGTYYTTVLNDIREWFDNGKKPKNSGSYSLTKEGETPKRYGNYNIFGEDIRLEAPAQEEVAPIQEDVAHESEVVAKNAIPTEDVAPMPSEPTLYELEQKQAELEDIIRKAMESNDPNAPKLIDEYGELLDTIAKRKKEESTMESERIASLDDADVPPVMEAPYYGESTDTTPENPFEERDIKAVGNRKVKAYMYENPEVKPFFQEEANRLLKELRDGTKGERWFNDQLYYDSGGEYGFSGTKRHVSADIAYLLDNLNFSYADIEKGINAIIEDNGAENNAASKRIEFILNDRLLKGYTDFTFGYDVPPNQDYINLLNEKQIIEYSDEARAKFFEVADKYAPPMEDIAPIAENTTVNEPKIDKPIEDAPIAEAYEAIKPKKEKTTEPRLKRVKEGEQSPNGKERKWVGTSTESEAVDGKILPDDLDQEAIHYQPISNKKTLDTANAKLDGMGYESSLAYFNSQFANKKTTVEDIVLGERLIQEAIKRGDTKTAGELIEDVAILGTELGQKVQALSIIKRLTPEGQLRMLQRTVERGKTREDKAYEGVEITQEMIDKILKAYNEDGSFDQTKLNEAVEDAKQKIADQMKVSKMDKVNAWRYLSMLGNPKTHIRNLVSNVAMRGTTAVKNVVARTIETVAPIENRTKTWKKASDEVKAFSQKTAAEMQDVLSDGGKYNEDASIKQKRAIFKNKILNGVYEFNSDMLSKEDWWFSKPAFTNALSEYLTANGINTAQDIENNPKIVAKAKQYATEQSQIATFRQYSWLANKINEIEHKNVATEIAIGAVLPFKKTPINIAKTALNYSPLGFAKTLTYDASQVKNGKMEASELVDHLAQNVTGSALVLIGYMLANAGFLNGAGEDDKEGKYDYQLGEQAYSINIGNATFSLSWLSPIAMPLFVGANAYEQLVEGKEWNGNVVVETLAQTLDPLSEMSFLSSLDSVLSSYDSGIEKFAGIAQSAAQSYTTQFVPTLSSQVAAVMDDTKRSAKVAADSDFKFVDETVNKLKYKIPFLRETLEPSTDIWGNDVKQTEDFMERAFETFIAPYAKKKDISSGVDEEIKALYGETGDAGLIPSIPYNYINYDGKKYEMSASEYTEYKKLYGQNAYELMSDLFNTSTYKAASSEERADMVNRVYDFARDEAKREYFAKYGVEFTNATKDGEEYYKGNSIKGAIEYDMTPDEYEFVTENPEKYKFFEDVGLSYEEYKNGSEDFKDAYSWAFKNPEKFTVSKAVASDVVTYRKYASDLYDIKADKDEDGKSISGSRKEKVIEYVNNLDIDYGARLILFKSEYNADDTYNYDIIDYLNNRQDISYEDMETILKELGFTVLSDGTIQWD